MLDLNNVVLVTSVYNLHIVSCAVHTNCEEPWLVLNHGCATSVLQVDLILVLVEVKTDRCDSAEVETLISEYGVLISTGSA
jgi:hypothetical protein